MAVQTLPSFLAATIFLTIWVKLPIGLTYMFTVGSPFGVREQIPRAAAGRIPRGTLWRTGRSYSDGSGIYVR